MSNNYTNKLIYWLLKQPTRLRCSKEAILKSIKTLVYRKMLN